MNNREKKLAIAVGAMVALWFANSGWEKYQAAVQKNQSKQQAVAKKLSEARLATARGERALRKLTQWQQQSLPTDPDFAKSLYQDWLRQQLTAASLEVKGLDFSSPRSSSKSYRQFSFEVSASGKLGQLTDFLYRFYQAPHLHRIRKATLRPTEDRKALTVSLTVDALSLPDAKRVDELAEGESDTMQLSFKQFQTDISQRDLFATYQAPQAVVADVPKETKDNEAAQAVFSGIHSGQDGWLMLVRMEKSGKVFYFRQGDQIKIGRFEGIVEQLDGDQRRAIVSRDSGRVQVQFGKSLAEAQPFGENAG